MPTADPPGTVLATAVVAWVITIAYQKPSPGVTVIHTNAWVHRFQTASRPRVVSSSQVMAVTAAHAWLRSGFLTRKSPCPGASSPTGDSGFRPNHRASAGARQDGPARRDPMLAGRG